MDENEIIAFKNMIEQANRQYLLYEVSNQFIGFLENGDSIIVACKHALYEWDVA
jgi:hypothetical protein